MAMEKNLLIFRLAVLFSIVTYSLAVEDQPNLENRKNNVNFLESLVIECFVNKNENSEVTYNGDNIVEVLNSEAGAELVLPSNNGIKINTKVVSNILSDCLKSNVEKLTKINDVREDIKKSIDERQAELSTAVDFIFDDQEIAFGEIDYLINSRSKRDLTSSRSSSEVLLKTLIPYLKEPINQALENLVGSLELLIAENKNNADSSTGVTNNALQTAVFFVSIAENQINTFFDENYPLRLVKSNARALDFPLNLFSGLIESLIVTPIKTTVNNILLTLNTTIYSLYTTESSDNGIQDLLNSIVNRVVVNIVGVISAIYTELNTLLDNFTL